MTTYEGPTKVGTVVPGSVTLHPCPQRVINLISGVTECRYIRVKNRVIIVNGSDHKIVRVINIKG